MSSQDPQAASEAPQSVHPTRERRGRARHAITLPASVRMRAPGVLATPTPILDLSEDGMGLQLSDCLPLDRTLALDLDLSLDSENARRIRLIGQVAWSQATGRTGVRFFSPDHSALQEIQQWLFLNAVASSRLTELLPLASQMTGDSAEPRRVPEKELFADEESADESGNEASSPLDLSPLARDTNAIVSRALALTGAKGAALALYEGGQLICRAICGTDTPALGARISTDSGITGECVRLGRVMYCSDVGEDERVDREVCADLGIRSILALPLFAGERIVGLLEVLSQRPAAFDPGDAMALDQVARPVMSLLFAEGKSEGLHRGGAEASRLVPDYPPEIVEDDEIDVAAIERRRLALTRSMMPGAAILRGVLEATAALAVVGAVTWLIVSQTRTLAALKSQAPAAATLIQPQVSHEGAAPPEASRPAPEPLEKLQAAAKQGDLSAQYEVGARYAVGEGVTQNSVTAAHWFTMAAKKGYAPAQGMLGACYWSGRGVPKDLKQAYFWSVLARDGNDEISKDRVDALVARLTPGEMMEVQQLVRDWIRKHPADPSSAPAEGAR